MSAARRWLAFVLVALATRVGASQAAPSSRGADDGAIGYPALLAELRKGDDPERQWNAIRRFATQPDAPEALAPLLAEMRRAAPELDNAVGLAVEQILRAHPSAPCPLEPLAEALRRPIWTSRQKCAQALLPLLERGDGRGRERELAAALIPLLASQRPRVFEAGRRCLEALTGEALGDAPERWLAWYAGRFGEAADMRGAVHEDLVVIRPLAASDAAAPIRFVVEGEELASLQDLRALVETRAGLARERGLALGAVVQVASERFEGDGAFQRLLAAPDVEPLLGLLLEDLRIGDFTLAPESDAFRAPWRAPAGD